MQTYNASTTPDPETWLELDEAERLELICDFVEKFESDIEVEAQRLHAAIHMTVENQLALNVEPTNETYARLRKQGLNRHDAVHAIGAVINEDIYEIMKGNKNSPFEGYKGRLRKLTAKRWKKGKW